MRRLLVLATLAATVGITSTASAAVYEVTKRGDPAPGACTANDCSLREAVLAADASVGVADRIVLPSRKPYRLAIPGADDGAAMGDLDLTNDRVKIVHPGKGRATIDADGIDRVFDVYAPAALKKLSLRGGLADYGGGARASARLSLTASTVQGNDALLCGGGIHTQSQAPLTLLGSRVTGNNASSQGGGLSISCFGDGGSVTIKNSTIAGNRSDFDGSGNGYGGGMYLQTSDGGRSSIRNSTIAGNSSGPGGIGGSSGGGVYTDLGRLTIAGTTISGNRAGDGGGGIYITGTDPLQVTNSTITKNRANDNGGGIHLDSGVASLNAVSVVRNLGNADGVPSEAGGGISTTDQIFTVRNSLIALNKLGALTPGDPPVKNDCSGADPFVSQGRNLLSTGFICDGFDGPGDRVRANPKLRRLADNGGATKTVALKKGSPAIDKARRSTAPNRDQRGIRRDRKPDIGAFERR